MMPRAPAEAATMADRGTQGDQAADDDAGRYTTVYSAGSFEEAHVVKGRLESRGIPALLRYEVLSRLYGSALTYGGVEVQVPDELVERARGVLSEDVDPDWNGEDEPDATTDEGSAGDTAPEGADPESRGA